MALATMRDSKTEAVPATSVHPKETTQQEHAERTYRERLLINHGDEYAATEISYEQLDSVQKKNRLDDLRECRTSAWYAIHLQSGLVRILSSSCRLRWCPMCASARSRLIVGNLTGWLQKRRAAKFLTLTLKHSDEDLSTQIIRLYACFSVLRRRVYIDRSIRGGVWFFQIKWSERSQQWHPHLHCVLDAEYMPHKRLKALWKSVTGDSDIVDIRAVRDPVKVAEYVARYAARPCELSGLNNLQRLQLLLAFHNRRLCGKWGDTGDLELTRTSANLQDEYVVVCPFSQLKKLAKISQFAEKTLVAFSSGKPIFLLESRSGLEAAVDGMYKEATPDIRPPPIVREPVFNDGDGSWLYRSYA